MKDENVECKIRGEPRDDKWTRG